MPLPWMADVKALTLDLDDTLWAIEPVIERAEQALHRWLAHHAPATAKLHDVPSLRTLRLEVEREWPHRRMDFTALRLESIRRALHLAGDDPELAAAAFEVFLLERQRVEFYEDVVPALERLSRRFVLFAVSNGNADLQRTGLHRWLAGGVAAAVVGASKPDARIFEAACKQLGLEAGQVLHAGDDPEADIAGARAAGLYTAWLRRDGSPHGRWACRPHLRARNLLDLAERIGA